MGDPDDEQVLPGEPLSDLRGGDQGIADPRRAHVVDVHRAHDAGVLRVVGRRRQGDAGQREQEGAVRGPVRLYALLAGAIAPVLERAGAPRAFGRYLSGTVFLGLGVLAAIARQPK